MSAFLREGAPEAGAESFANSQESSALDVYDREALEQLSPPTARTAAIATNKNFLDMVFSP